MRRWSLPEPIGEDVRRELARFGPAAGMADVVTAWPETVGAGIAANAWPARLGRDGTLHVATSSSTWAFELSQLGETILARLREALGGRSPGALSFAVGPLPERGAESVESLARTVPEVTPSAHAAADRIAASIEDLELRELVARAAAASLAPRSARPGGRAF